MSVTDRGHLSIGEVLALLQGEFPDVTISKIRFLESQGLIDPERTPSGYRKFYDADIARLRWILIQQRDHFLPLKVIKDRLDEVGTPGDLPEEPPGATAEADAPSNGAAGGDGGDGAAHPHLDAPVPDAVDAAPLEGVATEPAPGTAAAPAGTDPSPRQPPGGQDAPAAVAAEVGDAEVGDDVAEVGDAEVAGAGDADAAGGAGELRTAPPDEAEVEPSPVEETVTAPAPPPAADAAAGTPGPEEIDVADTTGDPSEGPAADEGEAASRRSSSSGRGGRGPGTTGRTRSAGRRRRAPVDVTSASFTIDELAAACETTVAGVEELERFGLISSRPVTGGRRYGDDALIVTKLAQRFAEFGIEARHLRMFRVAVDRELALYDQVVAPIARGRSDGGDVRASEIWAELDGLGAELRDALFHRGPA